MRMKKFNAVVALLSSIALLVHIGYCSFAYLTMYYNPNLKTLTAAPFIICTMIHAVCGMCIVFLQNDGTSLGVYKEQNKRTIIQRISAALIFPLLIVHLKTFELLKTLSSEGKWVPFALLMALQILFYADVLVHTALSFSKGLITLGIIQDRNKLKILDKVVFVVCTAAFLFASFAVIKGQLTLFLPE